MGQWGSTDDAANSVLWAAQQLKKDANTGNQSILYANTTESFISGMKAGVFGVSAAESGVTADFLSSIAVVSPGSGYRANAAVTVGGDGSDATANATANSTGRISAVNVTNVGTGYTNFTVTIDPPAAQTFNSNTALFEDKTFNALSDVANTTEYITISGHGFSDGDELQYLVAAGNTAVGGLVNATSYYIVGSNSTAFQLAASQGGAAINVTSSVTETGHTLRRRGFFEIGTNVLQTNDLVTYLVAAGNTALTGMANNTQYRVTSANTTGIYIAGLDGTAIRPAPGVTETGHSFTGQTATARAVQAGGKNKGVTPGWNLRTEGTGGRAGRVHNECLVAMDISGGDDSDDTILPDS